MFIWPSVCCALLVSMACRSDVVIILVKKVEIRKESATGRRITQNMTFDNAFYIVNKTIVTKMLPKCARFYSSAVSSGPC